MQPVAEKLLQRYEDFLEYANLFAILIKNRVPLFPCGMHSLLWSRSFGVKRR